MRTTLRIETSDKTVEVDLKIANGKQIVELELSEFLALLNGKSAKASSPSIVKKGAKVAKGRRTAKAASGGSEASVGSFPSAKRGRKPKATPTETISEPVLS